MAAMMGGQAATSARYVGTNSSCGQQDHVTSTAHCQTCLLTRNQFRPNRCCLCIYSRPVLTHLHLFCEGLEVATINYDLAPQKERAHVEYIPQGAV